MRDFFIMTPKKLNQSKVQAINELASQMKDAKSVLFVDYSGMGVKTQQELKNRLREVGGKMIVAKNTLLNLAGREAKLPEEALKDTVLEGQTAVVFASDDSISPVQTIGKFAKEFELPKMKAGVIDGAFQDSANLSRIASLPSKEVLVGQVMGSLASPMYGLVGTLQGNLQKLVFILKAKS
jgi:large subunit ribosomal protein L10